MRLRGPRAGRATTRGYAQLATWAESFGVVDKVGMEGTGSFGTTGGYSRGGTGTTPKAAEPGARRGRHGTDEVPVVTGVPVGRPPSESE